VVVMLELGCCCFDAHNYWTSPYQVQVMQAPPHHHLLHLLPTMFRGSDGFD
jgi:hypothetical protein